MAQTVVGSRHFQTLNILWSYNMIHIKASTVGIQSQPNIWMWEAIAVILVNRDRSIELVASHHTRCLFHIGSMHWSLCLMLDANKRTPVSNYYGMNLVSTAFGMHSNGWSDEEFTFQWTRSHIHHYRETVTTSIIQLDCKMKSHTIEQHPKSSFVKSHTHITADNCWFHWIHHVG